MVESFILPGDQLKCVVPWELKSTVTDCLLPRPFLKVIRGGDRSFKNRVRRLENEGMENDALWTGQDWFRAYNFLFVYFFAWYLLLNHPVNALWSLLSRDYPFSFSGIFCTERSGSLIKCCNHCHNTKLILLEIRCIFLSIPFAEMYKPNIDFKGYIFVLNVMLKNVLQSIICN